MAEDNVLTRAEELIQSFRELARSYSRYGTTVATPFSCLDPENRDRVARERGEGECVWSHRTNRYKTAPTIHTLLFLALHSGSPYGHPNTGPFCTLTWEGYACVVEE